VDLIMIGGIALGLGIAAGLNVYAAVAAIGIASRLGWFPLAPALHGLHASIVIGSAVLLYLLEALADRAKHTQRWWSAVHTLVRPLAASSLTAVAILATSPDIPKLVWVSASLGAGVVALLVHASKAGARLLLAVAGELRWNRAVNWAEDAVAVVFGPLSLAWPTGTLWIAGAMLVGLAGLGRWLWRAFLLGPRALAARGTGFFGARGWLEADGLPRWVARSLESLSPGQARHRGTRASMQGAPGRFRNGWLVVGGDGPRFLYRGTSGRVRGLPLEDASYGEVRADSWVDSIPLGSNGRRATLLLLKDGPDPEVVRRALEVGPT
jgi:hypothetical protein